jgi:hypothetical protein
MLSAIISMACNIPHLRTSSGHQYFSCRLSEPGRCCSHRSVALSRDDLRHSYRQRLWEDFLGPNNIWRYSIKGPESRLAQTAGENIIRVWQGVVTAERSQDEGIVSVEDTWEKRKWSRYDGFYQMFDRDPEDKLGLDWYGCNRQKKHHTVPFEGGPVANFVHSHEVVRT